MDKQTKHPGHVLMLVQFARWRPGRMSSCLLPACSASPFATLSAARIGYVECSFNGLNTHTHRLTRTQSASHPFTNLVELALVFRAVWLPWIAAAWFSSFFRFQFAPLLFPSPAQARHNFTACPARHLRHIVPSISSSWPVPKLTSWRILCGH